MDVRQRRKIKWNKYENMVSTEWRGRNLTKAFKREAYGGIYKKSRKEKYPIAVKDCEVPDVESEE